MSPILQILNFLKILKMLFRLESFRILLRNLACEDSLIEILVFVSCNSFTISWGGAVSIVHGVDLNVGKLRIRLHILLFFVLVDLLKNLVQTLVNNLNWILRSAWRNVSSFQATLLLRSAWSGLDYAGSLKGTYSGCLTESLLGSVSGILF